MKNFLSLVSDPTEFGRGHLSRQIQIQRENQKHKVQHIICKKNSDLSVPQLQQNTVLLLDLSPLDEEPSRDFLHQFSEIIGFDWSGKFIPDRNFVVVAHPNREYHGVKYVSVGLHNLIIQSDITKLTENLPRETKDYILISLGYGAGTNAYLKVLEIAKSYPKIPKILASGFELGIAPANDLTFVVDSPNFIGLLAEARAVITNGGTTYVESLLLGKATLPIPQTKDEQFFIEAMDSLTHPDSVLANFRVLDFELATKLGVGTQGALKLRKMILEN